MSLLNPIECLPPDTISRSSRNEAVSPGEVESQVQVHGCGGNPADGSDHEKMSWVGPAINRLLSSACDYIVGAILLVLLAPVMLGIILLVRLTSEGSPISTRKGPGRHGKPFVIYKVRTMGHGCERLTGPQRSRTNDPWVTSLGRFLRKAHLDELPQLLNVLRGEMSLVGPRSERPGIVRQIEKTTPANREILIAD